MPCNSDLLQYYDYWDNFVSLWKGGSYPRALYMPEPWWGWTPEDGDLHSVTLNLSPGQGGKLQTRPCVSCAMACVGSDSYSAAMYEGTLRSHLMLTERWHYNRRYKPLMEAFGFVPAPDTRHHLSVELSPFHDSFNNARFLEEHGDEVVDNVLKFAASASMLIVPPPDSRKEQPHLKDKVIVRGTIRKIRDMVNNDAIEECDLPVDFPEMKSIRVDTFRLKDPQFKDVRFICISGVRNNLPSPDNISRIIKSINKQLKPEE